MNDGKKRYSPSILFKIMIIISIVVIVTSTIFTFLLIKYRAADIIDLADARLLMAAELKREILEPDYHDKIFDEKSVSKEKFRSIVARNDELCRRLHLQYLWSVLLLKDRLVFTSATHSDLNNPDSPCASFFEMHRDPNSFAPALQSNFKPSFSSFKNEWGEGRQVLVPYKDSHGRIYILGASVQLTELNSMVRSTAFSSIGLGLLIIGGSFLLALVLARSFATPIGKLIDTAAVMATGDLDVILPSAGTRELLSLSQSLDQMRQSLKHQMAVLSLSEETHRTLIEEIPDIVMRFDRNGRHMFVSDNVRTVVDLPASAFIGKTHRELNFPEPMCQFWEEAIRSVFDKGTPFETEFSFQGKDKEIIFNWRLIPEISTSGVSKSVLSISRDITAHRKVEKEYQTLFREMLEGVALHEIICDEHGHPIDYRFLAVNPAFERMTGLAADEVIGKTVIEILPETEQHWIETYGRVALTGEPAFFENYHKFLGKHFEVMAFCPAINQFACIFSDITERKQAEQELQDSEKKYRTLFETMVQGVVYQDCEGKITSYNPAAESILGLTGDQIRGQTSVDPSWKAIYPDGSTFPGNEHPSMIALKTGQEVHNVVMGVLNPRRKDYVWVNIHAIPQFLPGEEKPYQVYTTFEDITERKRAESALRESQTRLKEAHRLAKIGIWNWTVDTDTVEWSEELYDIFGRDKNLPAPSYKDHPQIYDPKSWNLLKIAVDRALETGEPYQLELKFTRPDGTTRWVNAFGGRKYDSSLRVIGLHGTDQDITERKQAEEELQFRNVLLTTQQEVSIDGILLVDENARILMYNRRFVEMWGLPAAMVEERVDEPVLQFVTAQLAAPQSFLQRVQYLYEQKEETSRDELLLADGRTFDRYSAPMFGPNKRYYGRIWYFRDITERKQAEEALRQVNETLRAMLNAAPVAIIDLDREGLIKSLWNPAAEQMLGWRRDEVLGHFLPTVQEDNKEEFRIFRDWVHSGKSIIGKDVVRKRKDGSLIEYSIYAAPEYDASGQVIGNIAVLVDITDRKKAEVEKAQLQEQLVQAQKMEAIGTLAGGIAHDFNNILWAIMGFTEMTLMSLPNGSKEHRNLQQVMQAGQRAKDLVNQILAFSRKTEQEKKPLQISLIVKEAINLLRSTIPTTIEILSQITALQATVLADPTQIHQLIINLATNAAHAMREYGGTLGIGLEEMFLEKGDLLSYPELSPGAFIILSISDTGHGIRPELLNRIFEPFFTTKGVGEGTGMGLAVVYGIVKAYGGGISVSSRLGAGTTFTILLPKFIGGIEDTKQYIAPIPSGSGRILIIDDEKTLVDLIKEMLESLDYEVKAANSSLEALKIFQAQPDNFDLVITDQTMPHMDGMRLSKELRQHRPDIPIILCTGFSDKVSDETVKAAGINALLMKPINLRDLGETVKKVLDKENQ